MTFSRAVVIVASIAAALVARDAGAQGGAARPDSSPPRIVRLSGVVDVPMLNAGSENAPLPAVDVMVNGRGPFRFGIETGARFIIITADAAARANLATVSPGSTADMHVDSITIGSALLGDMTVTVLPRAPKNVDGLLGLPAFQELLLTIDYPHARVRLEKGSLPKPDGRTIFSLTRAADFWAFPVTFAGHTMTTIVDTRSTGAFALDPSVRSILPWASDPVAIGQAGGAGIPTTDIMGGTLGGDGTFGEYRITSPFLVLHQLPPSYPSEPRLGASVLMNFVVTLDQANARIRLLRDGPTTFALPRR